MLSICGPYVASAPASGDHSTLSGGRKRGWAGHEHVLPVRCQTHFAWVVVEQRRLGLCWSGGGQQADDARAGSEHIRHGAAGDLHTLQAFAERLYPVIQTADGLGYGCPFFVVGSLRSARQARRLLHDPRPDGNTGQIGREVWRHFRHSLCWIFGYSVLGDRRRHAGSRLARYVCNSRAGRLRRGRVTARMANVGWGIPSRERHVPRHSLYCCQQRLFTKGRSTGRWRPLPPHGTPNSPTNRLYSGCLILTLRFAGRSCAT